MTDSDNSKKLIQALTKNGILSREINVERLISASQEIATISGEKSGDWTFISPHYVYKGGAIDKVENYVKVMRSLSANGIINKEATLDQIVAASEQVSGISGAAAKGDWTFISPNFVYKGSKITDIAVNPIRQG